MRVLQPPPPESRRLAAIMFTDMVGYSALSQRDETLALQLLDQHNALLRPIFARHHGREVKTIGDAFLIEFSSAVDAVACGLEMQRTLKVRNANVQATHRLTIRIGIHVGDVVARDGDLFGDGVNIAARIEPQAPPGGVCVSEDVFRQVDRRAPAVFFRLGRVKLKNISSPMTIYQATEPGTPAPSVASRLRFALRRSPARFGVIVALAVAVLAALAVGARGNSSASATGAAPGTPAMVSVVVADVLNDTGETDLDGLSGLIITSLERSRVLHPLTRASMLDVLRASGSDPHGRLDESAVRMVAAQEKIGVLVRTRVQVSDSVYTLRLEVIDPAKDTVLFSGTEKVLSNRSFPSAIARVTSRMRTGLGEEALDETREGNLADLTTSDMEAYRAYFVGDALMNRMQMRAAEFELEKAVTVDPLFALAWVRLAYVRAWLVKDPKPAIAKALERQDRLPLKERYFLKLQQTISEGDIERAISLGRELVAKYPNEKEGWYCLGDLLHHRANFKEALPAFERALEIDPWFERANEHLVQAQMGIGDLDGAVATATRFVDRVPGPESAQSLVDAQLRKGDFEAAYATALPVSQLAEANSEQVLGPGGVRLYQGDAKAARAEFDKLAASPSARVRRDGRKGLAWVAVLEGRYRAAFKELDLAMALDRELGDRDDLARAMSYRAFLLAVGFGAAPMTIREVDEWLTKASELKSEDWVAHFYALRAWLALGELERATKVEDFQASVDSFRKLLLETSRLRRENHPEAAVATLETAFSHTDLPGGGIDLLMEAYADHPQKALAVMERIERLRGHKSPDYWSMWVYLYPHTQWLAYQADRAQNDEKAAEAVLGQLKARWANAESDVRDVALVKSAR